MQPESFGRTTAEHEHEDNEMDSGLEGKVAIVTGGGAADDGIGNGRAAALVLAGGGAKVLVVDREIERARRTVQMIVGDGGEA